MNFITSHSESKWISEINHWLETKTKQKAIKSIYLPAGDTPIPLYESWEEAKPKFLEQLEFVQLDEIVKGQKTGLFEQFFNKYLPSYVQQIKWISQDHLAGADAGILGIGLNGHIAFHEPGLPNHFTNGCVLLTDETKEKLKISTPSWGLTYGIADLLDTKALLVIARGKTKHSILNRFIEKDPEIPASLLNTHPDLSLFYLDN